MEVTKQRLSEAIIKSEDKNASDEMIESVSNRIGLIGGLIEKPNWEQMEKVLKEKQPEIYQKLLDGFNKSLSYTKYRNFSDFLEDRIQPLFWSNKIYEQQTKLENQGSTYSTKSGPKVVKPVVNQAITQEGELITYNTVGIPSRGFDNYEFLGWGIFVNMQR